MFSSVVGERFACWLPQQCKRLDMKSFILHALGRFIQCPCWDLLIHSIASTLTSSLSWHMIDLNICLISEQLWMYCQRSREKIDAY